MPNRDLPVFRVQGLALNVKVAFTEAALVAEILGVSPGPLRANVRVDGSTNPLTRCAVAGAAMRHGVDDERGGPAVTPPGART